MNAAQRFAALLDSIRLTPAQIDAGKQARTSVVRCLNQKYYTGMMGMMAESAKSMLIGSWSKDTQIRPPRDVDCVFIMPPAHQERIRRIIGNPQSYLLQEVKNVLLETFPNTDIRGDGPVVLVPFGIFKVEVVPAFNHGSTFEICITNY